MSNKFKEAFEKGEFVVTAEMIPGRSADGPALQAAIAEAKEIWETGRAHAVSITDNPGGNPAILADAMGMEFLNEGITPLVHFTCKDRNRNQILSQLYMLERAGVENLLLMTGDYQVGGWEGRSRPNFDLDSVHLQALCKAMNEGLEVQGRKGPEYEAPTHFFHGGVVNPFKYREGEVWPQYYKLERKIISGMQFCITQLGYDTRKIQELMMYLKERQLEIPIISNIFLLTKGAAKLMRKGAIAGCYISDELLAKLEEESQAEDKGKAARIERAAQMTAVAMGMGCAGVHIGGFGLSGEMFNQILDRAEELAPNWQDLIEATSFPAPEGYFVYQEEVDINGNKTGLNSKKHGTQNENFGSRKLFKWYKTSRLFHHWILTLGKRGNKILASSMERRDNKKGLNRHHNIEHTGKAFIYGCIDCGDCGLEACIYSCPMAQCPKCQRNGPCGGSFDGWGEVYPHERFCIWYMAYHRVK